MAVIVHRKTASLHFLGSLDALRCGSWTMHHATISLWATCSPSGHAAQLARQLLHGIFRWITASPTHDRTPGGNLLKCQNTLYGAHATELVCPRPTPHALLQPQQNLTRTLPVLCSWARPPLTWRTRTRRRRWRRLRGTADLPTLPSPTSTVRVPAARATCFLHTPPHRVRRRHLTAPGAGTAPGAAAGTAAVCVQPSAGEAKRADGCAPNRVCRFYQSACSPPQQGRLHGLQTLPVTMLSGITCSAQHLLTGGGPCVLHGAAAAARRGVTHRQVEPLSSLRRLQVTETTTPAPLQQRPHAQGGLSPPPPPPPRAAGSGG
jgi:hypothetical protein